jgi:hypothetical protein
MLITSNSTFIFQCSIILNSTSRLTSRIKRDVSLHFDCEHLVSIADISDYGHTLLKKDIAEAKLFYNRSNCLLFIYEYPIFRDLWIK